MTSSDIQQFQTDISNKSLTTDQGLIGIYTIFNNILYGSDAQAIIMLNPNANSDIDKAFGNEGIHNLDDMAQGFQVVQSEVNNRGITQSQLNQAQANFNKSYGDQATVTTDANSWQQMMQDASGMFPGNAPTTASASWSTPNIIGGALGGAAFATGGFFAIKYAVKKFAHNKILSKKYVQVGLGAVLTLAGVWFGVEMASGFTPAATPPSVDGSAGNAKSTAKTKNKLSPNKK